MNQLPKFEAGPRLFDGQLFRDLRDWAFSVENAITAAAGGGQANAYQLTKAINNVTVVVTAADSVKLPASQVGMVITLINSDSADSMQVFGAGTDTINGVATGTGVAQAAGKTAIYVCPVVGQWFRNLSA